MNRAVIGLMAAVGLGLAAWGIVLIATGEISPTSVGFLLFGLVVFALTAPRLRPGPVFVCDRVGMHAVRLSLRLRWSEIERMRLTKQRTSRGQSVTYLDVWPVDTASAIAQIRGRFEPFAGLFQYGGDGAIRVTIFLWSSGAGTVADEVECLSGRAVERCAS